MALLSGALKDRGRVLRGVVSGPKVEGRRDRALIAGQWFGCRLVIDRAPEVADRGGRRRIVERGVLVCQTTDLRTSDIVDIDSRAVGRGRWSVAGALEIVVTRRAGRGVVAPVERLLEPGPPETVV